MANKYENNILKKLVFLFFYSFFLNASILALNVDINQGTFQPIPIAIPSFATDTGETGDALCQVVIADLRNCGEFNLVNPAAYLQSAAQVLTKPRFSEWKPLNAQLLLGGQVRQMGEKIEAHIMLYDVVTGALLLDKRFLRPSFEWRKLAHQVADAIYKRVTGEEGYFNTKFVYVSQRGKRGRKITRLAIMDQDGANHRYLTGEEHLLLSPRFSPTSHEVAYMAFDTKPASVHLMNLNTGQAQTIGQFKGMTFAPRFCPKGEKLILSLSTAGVTSLYEMPLNTRELKRITQTQSSIDTSASYAPDGKQFVFNSDREGTPQLYLTSSQVEDSKRLSFGKGRYYTPVWSPRGDWIAFIKSYQGAFNLGVMRPDGTGERIIAQSYLMESPTWAPNGRILMFAAQSSLDAPSKLYSIDVTGHNLREIPTPHEGTHPAWSPLILD